MSIDRIQIAVYLFTNNIKNRHEANMNQTEVARA